MYSDIGPFGIVPRWVRLECKGQPWPLALYSLLADKADRSEGGDGGWTIGRETLAVELGTSASTVDRAVKHLEAIGALDVTHNKKGKEWSWSRYMVRAVQREVSSRVGQVSPPVVQVSSPVATFPITPNQKPPTPWERAFDLWWNDYPRKIGKPAAFKAFKAKVTGMSTGQMMAMSSGTMTWQRHWQTAKTEAQYIPHPATFINQERWNDSPPPAKGGRAAFACAPLFDERAVDECVDVALTVMGNLGTDDSELLFRLDKAVREQLSAGKAPEWIKQEIVFVASTVGVVL